MEELDITAFVTEEYKGDEYKFNHPSGDAKMNFDR